MRTFAMGEKTRLDDSAIRVEFDVSGEGLAAYCFSLGTADLDVVCAARPASLTSAVALVAGGTGIAEFHVDLSAVDDAVDRLVFAIGAQAPGFGAGSQLRLLGADDEIGRFVLPVGELTRERALILAEVYRRDGWRFGAVGQGYEAGLDQLVRDLGAEPDQALFTAAVMADPVVPDTAAHAEPAPEAAEGSEAEPEPAADAPEPARASETKSKAESVIDPEPAPESDAEPMPEPEIGSDAEPAPAASADVVAEPPLPAKQLPEPEAAPALDPADTGPLSPRPAPAVEYEGRGDRVLSIERPVDAGPFLVELESRGTENFVVWTLDADLETDKLLANTIGAHRSRALVDERGTRTSRLKIEADGAWTVRLLIPEAARLLTDRLEGTGPETVRWAGPRTVVAMTHAGGSNFIVGTFTEHGDDEAYLGTLANVIGDYEGESILPKGPCLIEMEADGAWTLTTIPD
ncbi:TerD family protein [Embleya sp. NPDC020630]|uniref:TerD family protein n=1 Tax=Embleya sp. NPDC020630 TaxID=3363979 RepID=UPI00378A7F70